MSYNPFAQPFGQRPPPYGVPPVQPPGATGLAQQAPPGMASMGPRGMTPFQQAPPGMHPAMGPRPGPIQARQAPPGMHPMGPRATQGMNPLVALFMQAAMMGGGQGMGRPGGAGPIPPRRDDYVRPGPGRPFG